MEFGLWKTKDFGNVGLSRAIDNALNVQMWSVMLDGRRRALRVVGRKLGSVIGQQLERVVRVGVGEQNRTVNGANGLGNGLALLLVHISTTCQNQACSKWFSPQGFVDSGVTDKA